MQGPQHTYPFGSETVVNVVIKSFIAANGKIVRRTVRQLGFVDGKIVHNPTCPFDVVYTDRELSLLKTLASKVMKRPIKSIIINRLVTHEPVTGDSKLGHNGHNVKPSVKHPTSCYSTLAAPP